jgi:formylglycine-generating enzyme required for sulfatase activity
MQLWKSGRERSILTVIISAVYLALLVVVVQAGVRWQQAVRTYAPPPPGMVYVPAGWFWMGSDDKDSELDERPLRQEFTAAYYIDAHEVTNREFKQFRPAHTYPAGQDELPVTKIFKPDAEAYARSLGKRLPTNAEWEKAARGTDARKYPWGNTFMTNCANLDPNKVAQAFGKVCEFPSNGRLKLPPGSFPVGASPYGAQDMAGNVWEWVSDNHKDSTWLYILGSQGERGIIRGGAYSYSPKQARTSHQAFEALNSTCNDVGFRCVMDARPAR